MRKRSNGTHTGAHRKLYLPMICLQCPAAPNAGQVDGGGDLASHRLAKLGRACFSGFPLSISNLLRSEGSIHIRIEGSNFISYDATKVSGSSMLTRQYRYTKRDTSDAERLHVLPDT